MPDVNFEWVKTQLTQAGVRQGPGDATLALLKLWAQLDLSENHAEDAIDIFSHLALNQSLINTPDNETWVPTRAGGSLQKGDIVRVKRNAFKGDHGIMHNGRKGKVTAIRSGDVIFRSTDGLEPFLDNVHYSFENLERRVK